jgi:hypothetical protein
MSSAGKKVSLTLPFVTVITHLFGYSETDGTEMERTRPMKRLTIVPVLVGILHRKLANCVVKVPLAPI